MRTAQRSPGRRAIERTIELVDVTAVGRIGNGRDELRETRQQKPTPASAGEVVLSAAHRDGNEPRPNPVGLYEAGEGIGGEQKGLLHDILELLVIAHQPIDDTGEVARVTLVQRGKGDLIRLSGALDERRIADPLRQADHVSGV